MISSSSMATLYRIMQGLTQSSFAIINSLDEMPIWGKITETAYMQYHSLLRT